MVNMKQVVTSTTKTYLQSTVAKTNLVVDKMSASEKERTELMGKLQSHYDGLFTTTECENTLVLVRPTTQTEVALEEIHFLKDSLIREHFVAMENGVAGYINKYKGRERCKQVDLSTQGYQGYYFRLPFKQVPDDVFLQHQCKIVIEPVGKYAQ